MLLGFAAGGVLILASVAWACVLKQGSLLVCQPPSQTYVNGGRCSTATGTGGQAGSARFTKAGSLVSVKARNMTTMPHSILFRVPGSNSSCTSHDGDLRDDPNVKSLLGVVDSTGEPRTVRGPRFFRRVTTPAVLSTGRAIVCVQDEPEHVTNQEVKVVVI